MNQVPQTAHIILHVTLGLDNVMIMCKIEHDGVSRDIATQIWGDTAVYMIHPMIMVDRKGTITLTPMNTLGNPVVCQHSSDIKRFHIPTLEAIRFYEAQVRKFEMLTKDPSLLNVLNELSRKVQEKGMTTEQAQSIFADLSDGSMDPKDALEEACEMAESNAPPAKRTLH